MQLGVVKKKERKGTITNTLEGTGGKRRYTSRAKPGGHVHRKNETWGRKNGELGARLIS